MKCLVPIDITPAMLVASSVEEDDQPAWASGTTYPVGALVVYANRIWKSVQASNTNHQPDVVTDPPWWTDTGPTNRWAMFDRSPSTATTATGSFSVTVAPGVFVNAVGLVGVAAGTVRLQQVSPDGLTTYYDQTQTVSATPAGSYWNWFFGSRLQETTQIVFSGLVPYLSARLVVSVQGYGTVRTGVLLVGTLHAIGTTLSGARSEFDDYSLKDTDDFGNVTVTERPYADNTTQQVLLDNRDLPRIRALRAAVRAKPCLWVGSVRNKLAAVLACYGFFDEFSVEIPEESVSYASISIKGLV